MNYPESFFPPPVAKAPFLVSGGFFGAVAVFIGVVAIHPLGLAELLGMFACVAAGSAFATVPFVLDFARRFDVRSAASEARPKEEPEVSANRPALSEADLARQIGEVVDARLEAVLPAFIAQLSAALAERDEKRRAEIQAAVASTPPRRLDTDSLPAPATGGKARLGRGLLGLMHAPGAIRPAEGPAEGGSGRDIPGTAADAGARLGAEEDKGKGDGN